MRSMILYVTIMMMIIITINIDDAMFKYFTIIVLKTILEYN